MKKWIPLAVLWLFLGGCSSAREPLQQAMALRSQILQASSVSFRADITADYGDRLQEFSMDCLDTRDKLEFTVSAPETISGITGNIRTQGGELTFQGHALAFPLMAQEQISPVSSPWVLMKTLRSGCITSAAREGEQTVVSMDDSYQDNALHLDLWLSQENLPQRCEILYQNRRILTLQLENFTLS